MKRATLALRFPMIAGAIALPLLLAACPKKQPGGADASLAQEEAGALAALADAGADGASGEDVEPVYPQEPNAPPMPLAVKLCAGLHEMPEKKRAACCSTTPGIIVMSECARMLSYALRHAAVDLAEADVDACIAAYDKTLDGCDWVGPFSPGPPPACQGIVKGKLAGGARCRSSLECTGDLRCLGVGPTSKGTCGPTKVNGDLCGGTVDSLATYARQTDVDKRHPECREKCVKHKCAPPVLEGGVCQTTADCGTNMQCLPSGGHVAKGKAPEKKCKAHPLPKENEACPGGVCGADLQCIKNKCTARKHGGAPCTADFECTGGCVRNDAGDKGVCGPRCDIR